MKQFRKGVLGGIVFVLMCCAVHLAPRPSWAAELKLGYVNLAKLFDTYQRTKESERVLTQKGEGKEAQLKGQAAELKKLRDNLELLNAPARDAKLKEIEEKSDAFQQLKTRTERDLVRERNQMAKTILDEIEQTVTDYAKAHAFSLIVDQRSLLYGQEAYDLTDELLKVLNDGYASRGVAKPPAATAKPAAKP